MGTTSSPTFPSAPLHPPKPPSLCYHPSLGTSAEKKTSSLPPQKSTEDFFPCHHIFSPAQTPPPPPKPSENPQLLLPAPPVSTAMSPSSILLPPLRDGDGDQHPFKDQNTPRTPPSHPCAQNPCTIWSPTLLVNPLQVVDIVPSLSGIFLSPPQKCCPISRVPGWK